MKRNIAFLIALYIGITPVLAGYIYGNMRFDNANRKYIVYVPDIYTTQNRSVPLLVGLHGFGDTIGSFSRICMSNIADTANYICVYPEALPDPVLGANAWNSGASTGIVVINNGVKDNAFINALVDTVISKYMIDTTRMYIFGFSFGGFMTDRLAAENSNRFAAAANVSGLRGNSLTVLPAKPMPYLKFHGTNDATIGYYGTSTLGFLPGLGMSAENTVKFWATQNQCNMTPVIDTMPDLANDGKRFVRFSYNNGRENTRVIFYKVINGEHRWYGLPANDISYCQTIWSFFRQYSRNSIISSVRGNQQDEVRLKIYPNPSGEKIRIDVSAVKENINRLNVYSITGNLMYTMEVKGISPELSIDTRMPSGTYMIQLAGENGILATEKVVIQ